MSWNIDRWGGFWRTIKGERNNSDVIVQVCYRAPRETEDLDDALLDQIAKNSKRKDTVIWG